MSKAENDNNGREKFERHAWEEAYRQLTSADEAGSIGPDDLDLLARAAYLTGRESACVDAWSRAHQAFRRGGDLRRAAGCAFWIGSMHLDRGQSAQAAGWTRRAKRLLDETSDDGPEEGYLFITDARERLASGEPSAANDLFGRAIDIGRRYDDPDLMTLGRMGRGLTLIHTGQIAESTAYFDDAMVAVVADELSSVVAGIVYCAVIDACLRILDIHRAVEWTVAFSNWCDARPDMIPYRGQCLIRRAQIMSVRGEWPDAMGEAGRVRELPRASNPPADGEALVLEAELHRLRGEFMEADEKFAEANRRGAQVQPGLALLRLAQGRVEAAVSALRSELTDTRNTLSRARLLPAFVDVMREAGELAAVRDATAELAEIADYLKSPFLRAKAARASGASKLDEKCPGEAITELKQAWSGFRDLDAGYEAARTRVLIGQAYRQLGDDESAEMEWAAAGWSFRELGAAWDLSHTNRLLGNKEDGDAFGLTPREMDVLLLLATGKTNREIAAQLFISERTVDRHVSSILSKLNVATRSAATAFAYEHDLL